MKRIPATLALLFAFAPVPAAAESEVLANGTVRVTGDGLRVGGGKTVAKGELPRWGMYEVRGESGGGETVSAGRKYFPEAGAFEAEIDHVVTAVELVPAPEGDDVVQKESGEVVLFAQDATTWGRLFRYEPKTEKNCLGWWVDPADWATWEFELVQAGRYSVSIFQGCGEDQGGSDVVVEIAGQKLPFKVRDTGGFQVWEELELGVVELGEAGQVPVSIRAVKKAAQAVMDVQKIVLKPVGAGRP